MPKLLFGETRLACKVKCVQWSYTMGSTFGNPKQEVTSKEIENVSLFYKGLVPNNMHLTP